ncbi:MAG: hypothetical protein C0508_00915 [Cyanobacteria bacterium PR.023]|nr:hypothetical protein [Cyanobacteria bacterium PR.3.49]MBA4073567.1 hypothetical protein [Cyanobacteria bacterium PR.023]
MNKLYEWTTRAVRDVPHLEKVLNTLTDEGWEIFQVLPSPLVIVARREKTGSINQMSKLEKARLVNPSATQEDADEDDPG